MLVSTKPCFKQLGLVQEFANNMILIIICSSLSLDGGVGELRFSKVFQYLTKHWKPWTRTKYVHWKSLITPRNY